MFTKHEKSTDTKTPVISRRQVLKAMGAGGVLAAFGAFFKNGIPIYQTYADDNLTNEVDKKDKTLPIAHNALAERDAVLAHPATAIAYGSDSVDGFLSKGSTAEFDSDYAASIGGYPLNARIMLNNGDIVRSVIANNTTNPNVNMTGWVKINSASQIFNDSGISMQCVSDRVTIIEERAVYIEDYNPAHSSAQLSTIYSTLTDAQVDYPSAYSLAQTIDTAAIQEAVNAANGRKVIAKEGANYYLSALNACPDTSAGKYSILVQNPVELITDGSNRATFIVPANQHGLVVHADDFKLNGINFDAVGTVGTIGHHIKCYASKRPTILNAQFKNVSDAAICFQTKLDDVLANFDNPLYDMFTHGCADIYVSDVVIFDAKGDAAIEIQGATGGYVKNNKLFNQKGHGVRCVGNKKIVIENNYGENIGQSVGAFAALVSCFSGAITPSGKAPRALYNSDISVMGNIGKNVLDFFHIGIGAEDVHFEGNHGTYTQRAIYLLNSGPAIGRWGCKNTFIRNNVLYGGARWFAAEVGTSTNLPPANSPLADNLVIKHNYFGINGSVSGTLIRNQPAGQLIQNSNITENEIVSDVVTQDSTITAIELIHVKDTDLSKNITNLTNGKELTVYGPTGTIKYGKREKIAFVRSGNTIMTLSRNDLKKGQRVTFETTGTLPSGLSLNTVYYLASDSSNIFAVNTDLSAAMDGTGITLSDGGTGIQYMNLI